MKKSDIASLDLDNSDDDALRDEIEPEDDNSDEDEINEESELDKYHLLKNKPDISPLERNIRALRAQNKKLKTENLELREKLIIRTKKYLFTTKYIRTLVKAKSNGTIKGDSKGKLTELSSIIALFLLLKYETKPKYGIPKFYTTEKLEGNIKEFMGLKEAPKGISAALTNLEKLGFISKESKAFSESKTKFKGKKGYIIILRSCTSYINKFLS